jgi:hypothetical protein
MIIEQRLDVLLGSGEQAPPLLVIVQQVTVEQSAYLELRGPNLGRLKKTSMSFDHALPYGTCQRPARCRCALHPRRLPSYAASREALAGVRRVNSGAVAGHTQPPGEDSSADPD